MNHKKALSSARLIAAAILVSPHAGRLLPGLHQSKHLGPAGRSGRRDLHRAAFGGAASSEEATETETTSEETASTETPSAGEESRRKFPLKKIPPASKHPPRPARKNPPPPKPPASNDWQTDAPGNHNMDPAGAGRPARGAAQQLGLFDGHRQGRGHHRRVITRGLRRAEPLPLKLRLQILHQRLIGIAIEQGYIGGVDDLLSDYLPQVLEQEDTRKHQITLEHLLTHTSGLEWYEWGRGYSNWVEFQTAPNWVDYILGRNLVYDPGTQFAYSTGNTPPAQRGAGSGNRYDRGRIRPHQSL